MTRFPARRALSSVPNLSSPKAGWASSRIVGHTGDQVGYRLYVCLDPAAASGVVLVFITTNKDGAGNAEMAALAREAIAARAP